MKTVGIICEYNPLHKGHQWHIEETRRIIGGEAAVICVMSGNFVQRGDFAIFNKHARAKMAICGGADLVIELPAAYTLQSAEGFARAGVYILDRLGICDYLSFGSEAGDIEVINDAALAISSEKAQLLTREWLEKGISYASAQQKAADAILGKRADVFSSPNNVLGIEYIKALKRYDSNIQPITVKRTGGDHDSDTGYSASALRKSFLSGSLPAALMPETALAISKEEIEAGRSPVSMKRAELAILFRLRSMKDFTDVPGISEGLESRFMRYAKRGSSVASILSGVKTKRYTMSRLRRMLVNASLGIRVDDTKDDPPYARVLAMNSTGKNLLAKARKKTKLPIITKPASVYGLNEAAVKLFELEAAATDLYVLAYQNEEERVGGQEWLRSPIVT